MSTAEKIAESALSLFYRQGYHATGVEQLSQVAGVTKKTLYRYFPSKEQLVEAALQRRDVEFLARLQQALAAAPAEQRPQAYVEFIAAWAQEADFHGCAFINAAAEYAAPSERPHVLAKAHKEALLARLVEVCTAAGLAQPVLVAHQLFLIGEGLIVACQVNGVQASTLEAARQMVAWLVSGAGTSAPA